MYIEAKRRGGLEEGGTGRGDVLLRNTKVGGLVLYVWHGLCLLLRGVFAQ